MSNDHITYDQGYKGQSYTQGNIAYHQMGQKTAEAYNGLIASIQTKQQDASPILYAHHYKSFEHEKRFMFRLLIASCLFFPFLVPWFVLDYKKNYTNGTDKKAQEFLEDKNLIGIFNAKSYKSNLRKLYFYGTPGILMLIYSLFSSDPILTKVTAGILGLPLTLKSAQHFYKAWQTTNMKQPKP